MRRGSLDQTSLYPSPSTPSKRLIFDDSRVEFEHTHVGHRTVAGFSAKIEHRHSVYPVTDLQDIRRAYYLPENTRVFFRPVPNPPLLEGQQSATQHQGTQQTVQQHAATTRCNTTTSTTPNLGTQPTTKRTTVPAISGESATSKPTTTTTTTATTPTTKPRQ